MARVAKANRVAVANRVAKANRTAVASRYISTFSPLAELAVTTLLDGDSGATTAGWVDASGAGHSLTFTASPTIVSSALNSHTAVRFNGTSQFGTGAWTWNLPAMVFMVVKMISVGAAGVNDCVTDGGTLGSVILINDTTPRLLLTAGASLIYSASVASGAYKVISYSITAGGFGKIYVGEGLVAQGNASTNNPGGLTLAALQNGSRFTNIEVAYVIGTTAIPTTGTITRTQRFLADRFAL